MDHLKLIAMCLIILLILALAINKFFSKSKEEQIDIVIYWLRAVVYEAEKELGRGTGQLKLATVYNAAIKQFPWLANVYTYERFDEELVKPALIWLNTQMASNENVKKLLGM